MAKFFLSLTSLSSDDILIQALVANFLLPALSLLLALKLIRKKEKGMIARSKCVFLALLFYLSLLILFVASGFSIVKEENQSLDEKVRNFLERHRWEWRDMNVSEEDGKLLYGLILKNNYKSALEIGTSTGHSAIWIAWALSKTGGKLITIEIDEGRYSQALKNFREAGLSDYIEARLGDAHLLVPELAGSFDFVFCDADKDWYKNYLIAILPKLEVGGCFAAHNVSGSRRGWGGEFFTYVESLPNLETTILRSSWAGISISYKRSERQISFSMLFISVFPRRFFRGLFFPCSLPFGAEISHLDLAAHGVAFHCSLVG